MIYWQASNDSLRCGDDTATTTETSPGFNVPTRWLTAQPNNGHRCDASSIIFLISATAIDSYASYSSHTTFLPLAVFLTVPMNAFTAPAPRADAVSMTF